MYTYDNTTRCQHRSAVLSKSIAPAEPKVGKNKHLNWKHVWTVRLYVLARFFDTLR